MSLVVCAMVVVCFGRVCVLVFVARQTNYSNVSMAVECGTNATINSILSGKNLENFVLSSTT